MTINASTFGLKTEDLEIIIQIIRKYPEISSAVIFGSRAMGNYKKGSDVDIALKGDNVSKIVHKVSGELNDESPLPYMFDIISYETENQALKEHIDQVGKRIL